MKVNAQHRFVKCKIKLLLNIQFKTLFRKLEKSDHFVCLVIMLMMYICI